MSIDSEHPSAQNIIDRLRPHFSMNCFIAIELAMSAIGMMGLLTQGETRACGEVCRVGHGTGSEDEATQEQAVALH